MFPALGPHQLRESIQDTVANRSRRLGSYVSRRYAGAPGRHHQARHLALLAQRILNFSLLVGHYQAADYVEGMRLEQLGHYPPGHIHPLPQEAGVAHGNDSCTQHKQVESSFVQWCRTH